MWRPLPPTKYTLNYQSKILRNIRRTVIKTKFGGTRAVHGVDLGDVRKDRDALQDGIRPEEALTTTEMTEEGIADAKGHPGGGRIVIGGRGDQGHLHRPEAPMWTNPPNWC